ncbi:MAG: hypothetical protein DHS20C05_07040 [Hyphococcus sp.]|nr:MAG: hypothetical protein DHS20C05_07040 [Marinicaulis sp.]
MAVSDTLLINATSEKVVTKASAKAAISYAEKQIGEKRLKGLFDRSASFDEVCRGLVDIYASIADAPSTPEKAAAMRHWVFPKNLLNQNCFLTSGGLATATGRQRSC